MFGRRIRLFKLMGFEVGVDASWIVIAVLIAWSLSTGFFPFRYRNLSTQTYWIMGIVGALGLFLSIIAHEFSHSIVARRFGMPMKGITLFIFGGVAEMGEEPPNPRAEFMMAIVGPISSMAIGALFYLVYLVGEKSGWADPVNGVLRYVAWINGILAVFNMVPAFPLDGGRVLRSILWGWKNNLRWATRVSSAVGSGFGIFLVVMGFVSLLGGNIIGGMWYFLIGMFLQSAAKMSYQQLVTRKVLEGEPLKRFMNPDPVTVSPSLTVEQLVEDYIYRHHYKMFPVVENGLLVGCVTTKQVKEVPRAEWKDRKVESLLTGCSTDNTVDPDADAMKAISMMRSSNNSRLMVVKEGRLLGVIALKDMLEFLALKVELDE